MSIILSIVTKIPTYSKLLRQLKNKAGAKYKKARMLKNKNISIIIPAFNESKFISDCLESLIPQLAAGDEVIVIDNNSTDDTFKIASSFENVKVCKEIQQGQVFAQRQGFDIAKNDILVRIDADTLVLPGWANKIKQHFQDTKTMAITGPGWSYDLNFKAIQSNFMGFFTFRTNRLLSGHYPLWGSNFAMRRSVWKSYGNQLSYKTNVWEDFELGIIFAKNNIAIKVDNTMGVTYSNRNAVNSSISNAIAYQFRAVRTYWFAQSKRVAVLSFIERLLMVIAVAPLYLLEPVLGLKKRIDSNQQSILARHP